MNVNTRYRLIIAYDGTDYHGWQFQDEVPSVAGVLIDTFKRVFNRSITLQGASRTDAGVHAHGQTALCTTDLEVMPATLMHAWNNLLPSSILLRDVMYADEKFNLYTDVIQKTYWYHFFLERPLPMVARYGTYYRFPVDFDKLYKALQVFVGTHDFRSFCTGDEMGDDTIRTIDSIDIEYIQEWEAYRIVVKGPKFLRYMIRRIVGAALESASNNNISIDFVKEILQAKNPAHSLPNAPARGLTLHQIDYQ